MKKLKRHIALLTAVFHLLTGSVWAVPAISVVPAALRAEAELSDLVRDLDLPPSAARVTLREPGATPGSPVIIHIQDAHANAPAQRSIIRTLEVLEEEYGIRTLFLEGAVKEIDPARLHTFSDKDRSMRAADLLLERGIYDGADTYLLKKFIDGREPAVRGFGIEEPGLYRRNLEEFRSVYAGAPQIESGLSAMRTRLESAATHIFNRDLNAFVREWLFHEDHPAELMRFAALLKKQAAAQAGIDLSRPRAQQDWPQLFRFFKLRELESRLDAERARDEKIRLLEWLESRAIDASAFSFLAEGASLPPGFDLRAAIETFYDAVQVQGFRFADFPALATQLSAQILHSEIEAAPLMEETSLLTERLAESLTRETAEASMLERVREYLLIRKILRLELTHEDYLQLLQTGERLMPSRWSSDLGEESQEISALDGSFKKARAFYETVEARDKIMFENLRRQLYEAGEDRAVLITGGFHARGFERLSRENGFGYVRVMPHMSEIEGHEKYLRVITLEADRLARLATVDVPQAGDPYLAAYLFPYHSQVQKMQAWARETVLREALTSGRSEMRMFRAETPGEVNQFVREVIASSGRIHVVQLYWSPQEQRAMVLDEEQAAGLGRSAYAWLDRFVEKPLQELLPAEILFEKVESDGPAAGNVLTLDFSGHALRSELRMEAISRHAAETFGLGAVNEVTSVSGGGGVRSQPVPVFETPAGRFLVKRWHTGNLESFDGMVNYVRELQAGGIPVPMVAKTGRPGDAAEDFYMVYQNPENGETGYYTVERWADGHDVLRSEASEANLEAAGRLLGKIHRITLEKKLLTNRRDEFYNLDKAFRILRTERAQWLEPLKKSLPPADRELITRTLEDLDLRWTPEILDRYETHAITSDLNFGGLKFNEEGTEVVAVFDWDQIRDSHLFEDLTATLMNLGRREEMLRYGFYVGDFWHDLQWLLKGYEAASGRIVSEQERALIPVQTKAMILLHMVSAFLARQGKEQVPGDIEKAFRNRLNNLRELEQVTHRSELRSETFDNLTTFHRKVPHGDAAQNLTQDLAEVMRAYEKNREALRKRIREEMDMEHLMAGETKIPEERVTKIVMRFDDDGVEYAVGPASLLTSHAALSNHYGMDSGTAPARIIVYHHRNEPYELLIAPPSEEDYREHFRFYAQLLRDAFSGLEKMPDFPDDFKDAVVVTYSASRLRAEDIAALQDPGPDARPQATTLGKIHRHLQAEGSRSELRVFTAQTLEGGFETNVLDRKVHVRGIYPEVSRIRNYLTALSLRTETGRRVVPEVVKIWIPVTLLDYEKSAAAGRLVLVEKGEDLLPQETLQMLRTAVGSGGQPLFEIEEMRSEEDYLRAAGELGNIDGNTFFSTMSRNGHLIVASEWIGPDVRDYLASGVGEARQRELGRLLGETLGTLHRNSLIADDTHLKQFVVRENRGRIQDVLRIDLVGIKTEAEAHSQSRYAYSPGTFFAIEQAEVFSGLQAAPVAKHEFLEAYGRSRSELRGGDTAPVQKLTLQEIDRLKPQFKGEEAIGFFKSYRAWREEEENRDKILLVIARHVESASNLFEYNQSDLTYSPPTLRGRRQRQHLTDLLTNPGIPFDRVVSSSIERAHFTVADVARRQGIEHEIRRRLNELMGHPLHGIPRSVMEDLYKKFIPFFNENPFRYLLPGFSGEYRIKYLEEFFGEIEQRDEKNILIGSHGLTLRLILEVLLRIPYDKDRAVFESIGGSPNVGLTALAFDPKTREWKLLTLYENSYLPEELVEGSRTPAAYRAERAAFFLRAGTRIVLRGFGLSGPAGLTDFQPFLVPLIAPTKTQEEIIRSQYRRTYYMLKERYRPDGREGDPPPPPAGRSELRATLAPTPIRLTDYMPADTEIGHVILASDNSGTLVENRSTPLQGGILGGLRGFLGDERNRLIVNSGDPYHDIFEGSQLPLIESFSPSMRTRYHLISDGGKVSLGLDASGEIAYRETLPDWPAGFRLNVARGLADRFYDRLRQREGQLAGLLTGVSDEAIETSRRRILDAIERHEQQGTWGVTPAGEGEFQLPLVDETLREAIGFVYLYDVGSKITLDIAFAPQTYSLDLVQAIESEFNATLNDASETYFSSSGPKFVDITSTTKGIGVETVLRERILPGLDDGKQTVIFVIGDGSNDFPAMTMDLSGFRNVTVIPVFLAQDTSYALQVPGNAFVASRERLQGSEDVIAFASSLAGKKAGETGTLPALKWSRSELRSLAEAPRLEKVLLGIPMMDIGAVIRNGGIDYEKSFEKFDRLLPAMVEHWGLRNAYFYNGLYRVDLDGSGRLHQVPDTGVHFIETGRATFMVGTYDTKREELGGMILRDRHGNSFSIYSMLEFNPKLSRDGTAAGAAGEFRESVRKATALGVNVYTDFIPWLSPGAITEENLDWTFHEPLPGDQAAYYQSLSPKAKQQYRREVLRRDNNFFVFRRDNEQIERVRHLMGFGPNVDETILNPYHPGVKDYYLRSLKNLVDTGVSGVRVDLAHVLLRRNLNIYLSNFGLNPGALRNYPSEEPWRAIVQEIQAYAAAKGQTFDFIAEVYDAADRAALQQLGFRVYYPNFFKDVFKMSHGELEARDLEGAMTEAILNRGLVVYASNFDETPVAVRNMAGDSALAQTAVLPHLGDNRDMLGLVTLREALGMTGDAVPIVGGDIRDGKPDLQAQSAHPHVQTEAELAIRTDIEKLAAAIPDAPLARVKRDLAGPLNLGEITDMEFLDNANRARFETVAWETAADEGTVWNILATDVRGGDASLDFIGLPRKALRDHVLEDWKIHELTPDGVSVRLMEEHYEGAGSFFRIRGERGQALAFGGERSYRVYQLTPAQGSEEPRVPVQEDLPGINRSELRTSADQGARDLRDPDHIVFDAAVPQERRDEILAALQRLETLPGEPFSERDFLVRTGFRNEIQLHFRPVAKRFFGKQKPSVDVGDDGRSPVIALDTAAPVTAETLAPLWRQLKAGQLFGYQISKAAYERLQSGGTAVPLAPEPKPVAGFETPGPAQVPGIRLLDAGERQTLLRQVSGAYNRGRQQYYERVREALRRTGSTLAVRQTLPDAAIRTQGLFGQGVYAAAGDQAEVQYILRETRVQPTESSVAGIESLKDTNNARKERLVSSIAEQTGLANVAAVDLIDPSEARQVHPGAGLSGQTYRELVLTTGNVQAARKNHPDRTLIPVSDPVDAWRRSWVFNFLFKKIDAHIANISFIGDDLLPVVRDNDGTLAQLEMLLRLPQIPENMRRHDPALLNNFLRSLMINKVYTVAESLTGDPFFNPKERDRDLNRMLEGALAQMAAANPQLGAVLRDRANPMRVAVIGQVAERALQESLKMLRRPLLEQGLGYAILDAELFIGAAPQDTAALEQAVFGILAPLVREVQQKLTQDVIQTAVREGAYTGREDELAVRLLELERDNLGKDLEQSLRFFLGDERHFGLDALDPPARSELRNLSPEDAEIISLFTGELGISSAGVTRGHEGAYFWVRDEIPRAEGEQFHLISFDAHDDADASGDHLQEGNWISALIADDLIPVTNQAYGFVDNYYWIMPEWAASKIGAVPSHPSVGRRMFLPEFVTGHRKPNEIPVETVRAASERPVLITVDYDFISSSTLDHPASQEQIENDVRRILKLIFDFGLNVRGVHLTPSDGYVPEGDQIRIRDEFLKQLRERAAGAKSELRAGPADEASFQLTQKTVKTELVDSLLPGLAATLDGLGVRWSDSVGSERQLFLRTEGNPYTHWKSLPEGRALPAGVHLTVFPEPAEIQEFPELMKLHTGPSGLIPNDGKMGFLSGDFFRDEDGRTVFLVSVIQTGPGWSRMPRPLRDRYDAPRGASQSENGYRASWYGAALETLQAALARTGVSRLLVLSDEGVREIRTLSGISINDDITRKMYGRPGPGYTPERVRLRDGENIHEISAWSLALDAETVANRSELRMTSPLRLLESQAGFDLALEWLFTYPNAERTSTREDLAAILTAFKATGAFESIDPQEVFERFPQLGVMHEAYRRVTQANQTVPPYDLPAVKGKEGFLRPWVQGPNLLNVGSGQSLFEERSLRENPRVQHAIGVDIEAQRSREFQIPAGKTAEFRLMQDPVTIPVEDGWADTLILTFVLHHVDVDREAFLNELKRVLKPGGRILVMEDTFSSLLPVVPAPGETSAAAEDLFRQFDALPSVEEKIAFLHFADWFVHHFVNRSRAPLVPGNYETMANWQQIFENAGFHVSEARNLGLAKLGSRNPVPRGMFVLEKKDRSELRAGASDRIRPETAAFIRALPRRSDPLEIIKDEAFSRTALRARLRAGWANSLVTLPLLLDLIQDEESAVFFHSTLEEMIEVLDLTVRIFGEILEEAGSPRLPDDLAEELAQRAERYGVSDLAYELANYVSASPEELTGIRASHAEWLTALRDTYRDIREELVRVEKDISGEETGRSEMRIAATPQTHAAYFEALGRSENAVVAVGHVAEDTVAEEHRVNPEVFRSLLDKIAPLLAEEAGIQLDDFREDIETRIAAIEQLLEAGTLSFDGAGSVVLTTAGETLQRQNLLLAAIPFFVALAHRNSETGEYDASFRFAGENAEALKQAVTARTSGLSAVEQNLLGKVMSFVTNPSEAIADTVRREIDLQSRRGRGVATSLTAGESDAVSEALQQVIRAVENPAEISDSKLSLVDKAEAYAARVLLLLDLAREIQANAERIRKTPEAAVELVRNYLRERLPDTVVQVNGDGSFNLSLQTIAQQLAVFKGAREALERAA